MKTAVLERLARRRSVVQAAVDACIWIVALLAASMMRLDFGLSQKDVLGVASVVPVAIAAQLFAGYVAGLYRARWRYGSFDEVQALSKAAVLTTILLFGIDAALGKQRAVPLSATIGAGVGALMLMAGVRYVWRLRLERSRRPSGLDGQRLLVFGAGEGGAQVITAMLRDPTSPYYPVGLIDDDPTKRNLRILGVPVVGDRSSIPEAAEKYHADAVLVAVPSADSRLMTEVTEQAEKIQLPVKVLPPVRDLFGTGAGVSDIRDIDVGDFLGRHRIETDIASIADYVTGKRVLVTGAGGSIGSELCRQLSRFGPAELIMLDRNEAGLHAVQLSIEGRALLDDDNLVLGDIRDIQFLFNLFAERRPQVVFHAAALKHLPLLEKAPGEAIKTNVWGTLAVLEAAASFGVDRFVNISTDKAADPTSVLGYSKRIAERLTAHFGQEHADSGCYLSVRFGNVLGSSGSVLTTFKAQLTTGGPITVTHPEVTRFFMTVEEAVELVIQAGAIGRAGEALVLDMGEPVRIADVAARMAGQAPRPVRIVYTGLRPGEKLHEVLFGTGERDERPVHPLISHVEVPPLDPLEARAMDPWRSTEELIDAYRDLVAMESESSFDLDR